MNDSSQDLRFFKIILSSIADGVFTVDNSRIITSFNPAAEKITRIPATKAIGKRCRDVFHSDICAKVRIGVLCAQERRALNPVPKDPKS